MTNASILGMVRKEKGQEVVGTHCYYIIKIKGRPFYGGASATIIVNHSEINSYETNAMGS